MANVDVKYLIFQHRLGEKTWAAEPWALTLSLSGMLPKLST